MSTISLYSPEASGLKLGPGVGAASIPGELIVFRDGFATVEEDDYPNLQRWLTATGTPQIRVLEEGEATNAQEASAGHVCPICDRSLKTEFGLNSHLRTHAPKS